MTELLYLTDSYLKEFDAMVTEITQDGALILDTTAFFPGGGGQPCDVGQLESGRPGRRQRRCGEQDRHVHGRGFGGPA